MHTTRLTAKYKCSACGRRYQRTSSSYWTENPFNNWQGHEEEKDKECLAKVTADLAESICPCGNKNQRLPEKKAVRA